MVFCFLYLKLKKKSKNKLRFFRLEWVAQWMATGLYMVCCVVRKLS